MRVLITGAGGFAGKHLAEFISKIKGIRIFGLSRHASKKELPASVQAFDGDVRHEKKLSLLLKKIKPERIFHLAASASVSQAWRDPQTTFQNNAEGTRSLLESVRRTCPAARVLVASSAEVYGSCQNLRAKLKESSPLRPMNPYAVSKVAQEYTAYQYFLSYGMHVVRTRAFSHIGPGQSDVYATASFARQVARIEAGRQKAVIHVGNLNAVRDFSDVRDVTRAYWLCLEKGIPGAVYNVCRGRGLRIEEILKFYLRQSAVTIRVQKDPGRFRTSDSTALVGNAAKLRLLSGWQAEFSHKQSLLDILSYWRRKEGLNHGPKK